MMMKLRWRYLLLTTTTILVIVVTMATITTLSSFKDVVYSRLGHPVARQSEMDDMRAVSLTTQSTTPSAASIPAKVEVVEPDMTAEPDMTTRQKQRHDVLREACSALEFDTLPPQRGSLNLTSRQIATLRYTYAIDHHRLLYCYVPKVSCTNWKRLFLVSKGVYQSVDDIKDPHTAADSAFRRLSQLATHTRTVNEKLNAYPSFFFVRDPFSRLLSAYREKIEYRDPSKCFFSKFITRWLAKTDPKYLRSKNLTTFTKGYSFPEFIRYIVERRSENEHWNDQYQLCSPCLVSYDFIGKYETLKRDADDFIRTFVNNASMSFPAPQKRPTHSSSDQIIARYYAQIPDRDLEALIACVYTDMRLFGYVIPDAVRRPGLNLAPKYSRLVDIG